MKNKIKILAALLCAAPLFAAGEAFALKVDISPLNPAYVEYMKNAKAREASPLRGTRGLSSSASGGGASVSGYVPSPLNWSHLKGKRWNVPSAGSSAAGDLSARRAMDALSASGGLPEKFDLREEGMLTPVKDQRELGNCWTHAAMAATESNLIKKGFASQEGIELSEWYITYYAYHPYGDMAALTNISGLKYSEAGGDDWKAVALLSRGTGSVTADKARNVNTFAGEYIPQIFERDYKLDNAYYLGLYDDRELQLNESRRDIIKRALMEHGALSVGIYYMEDNYFCDGDDKYFYYTGLTYGEDDGVSTNHAVTLVGWDDTIPAEKFKDSEDNMPEENGAWIIRNSYGEDEHEGGYFYVSYAEATLCDGVAYDSSPARAGETIYQYDPLGCVSWFGLPPEDDEDEAEDIYAKGSVAYFANIFDAEQADSIYAAALYVPSPDVSYEISLYTNCSGDSPVSGSLAATVSKTSLTPGYNTVEFDAPVRVAAGTKFSVVVKTTLNEEGFGNTIPIETAIAESHYANAAANPGEGWISRDGADFIDITKAASGDGDEAVRLAATTSICVKAFGEGTDSSSSETGRDFGSSGGCSAGVSILALLALVPFALRKKR